MRIVSKTVYFYSELSEPAQANARDWYRRASDGDSFSAECVLDDAETIGGFFGLDMRQRKSRDKNNNPVYAQSIYYSGFSSQGDGACFAATWRADSIDLAGLASHAPRDKELARIGAEFARIAAIDPAASFRVKHKGHYSHERCTEFEFNEANKLTDDMQRDLIEAARDFMRWIYRALEKDYEFQNSDESIIENIECNEYEFDIDGARA